MALVDAEGHVLARAFVPAKVQDRDTLPTLDDGKKKWPGLRRALLDGAFTAESCRARCSVPGCSMGTKSAVSSISLGSLGGLGGSGRDRDLQYAVALVREEIIGLFDCLQSEAVRDEHAGIDAT